MVIDFHTHTFPEKIAAGTISKLEGSSGLTACTDGTVNGLLRSMAEGGVDYSVVLPVVTNIAKTEKINDSAAEVTNRNCGIISFGGVHPRDENYKETLKNIAARGLKGIKFHPDYQETDFDEPCSMRVLDYAEELGLITVVHAGFDGSYPTNWRCTVKSIVNVIETVKPKKLVLAHMGGHSVWGEVKKYIAGADVYLDTATSFGNKLKQYVPNLLSEEEFIDLVRLHGTDKVLFATDSPWSDQKDTREFIENSALTEKEKADILGENGARLLRL